MEEKAPSTKSETISAAELELPNIPIGQGPKPHPPRFYNPVDIDNYFRPLNKNPPSAEERWARKADAQPFEL